MAEFGFRVWTEKDGIFIFEVYGVDEEARVTLESTAVEVA